MSLLLERTASLGFSLAILISPTLNADAQSFLLAQETIPPNSDILDPTLPSVPQTPAPPIPEVPQPPREPNLQIPATSPSFECISPSTESDRFLIREVKVEGNTVLDKEIEQLIAPFENREVTFEELICLRSKITELYLENGYVNSGAFLPNNQDLSRGIVQIQVVEGELESIEVIGLQRLQEGYVRSRLELAATKPLDRQRLEEALELLQLDPLLEQVNAELTAGNAPGRSILLVNLKEASAFHAGIAFDNYRPPSIGSAQGSIFIAHDNLLGFGDRASAEYNLTEGLDFFNIGYAIPLNALNGTLNLRYENYNSDLIDKRVRDLDISSETQTFSVSFRQPIIRTPESEFALGLALDLRRNKTFLLGEPFSFSIGVENGESQVTVIRFFQDWIDRSPTRVIAIRSQFSFGINAFGATINDTGTDGRFFTWLGQFQWVQQLSPRTLLLARIDTQLTPDSLLPLEQFGFGGVDTVRGYRQNQLVTDNGILSSLELRIPLTSDPNVLQLTPFVEVGTGWNERGSNPEPSTLVSTGLGIRWLITPDLSVRLDYGIPLIAVENSGNSLQEDGFYFSLRYQPF